MYGGEADMSMVAKVKNCLHIPLIANGDITTPDKAIAALMMCGGDGIAIGRGAIGNPFLFREIISAIEGKPYNKPTLEERVAVAIRQVEYAIADKGEVVAVREARGQIAHYFKGFRGAAECRFEINRATTLDDIKRAIEKNIEKS
jgi:tRNA-dihydrouridine synthase